jgi:hypothetical protein
VFFGLLGDIDLLVSVLGSADDLDDGHGGSVDVVDCFNLVSHGLEDGLDLGKEGHLVHLAVLAVWHCHDIDVRLEQAQRGLEGAEHLELDVESVGELLPYSV